MQKSDFVENLYFFQPDRGKLQEKSAFLSVEVIFPNLERGPVMMLFFRSCFYSKSLTRHSNPRYLKKICAPLQVQICKIQIYLKKKESGKRALSWVSFKGSLTLEAALCFPLMVFFCVTLLMPMVLMDRQRQIQAVAEAVGEEISRYAYAAYLYENEKTTRGMTRELSAPGVFISVRKTPV